MSSRCPVCKVFYASQPGDIYEHAKSAHPVAVVQYLGSTLFDRDPMAVDHRPTLEEQVERRHPEEETCADGTCPCWELRLKRRKKDARAA